MSEQEYISQQEAAIQAYADGQGTDGIFREYYGEAFEQREQMQPVEAFYAFLAREGLVGTSVEEQMHYFRNPEELVHPLSELLARYGIDTTQWKKTVQDLLDEIVQGETIFAVMPDASGDKETRGTLLRIMGVVNIRITDVNGRSLREMEQYYVDANGGRIEHKKNRKFGEGDKRYEEEIAISEKNRLFSVREQEVRRALVEELVTPQFAREIGRSQEEIVEQIMTIITIEEEELSPQTESSSYPGLASVAVISPASFEMPEGLLQEQYHTDEEKKDGTRRTLFGWVRK